MEELIKHATLEEIKVRYLDTNVLTRLAARHARIDILEYLKETEALHSSYTCDYAAAAGHLHVLKWLKENISPSHLVDLGQASICYNAAMIGRLDILLWGLENDFYCDMGECYFVANFKDRLDVLEYLHSVQPDLCAKEECKLCKRKMRIIQELAEPRELVEPRELTELVEPREPAKPIAEGGSYIDWLSSPLIRDLFQ